MFVNVTTNIAGGIAAFWFIVFFFSLTAVHGLFLNVWYPSADPAGIIPVKLYPSTGMGKAHSRYKLFCGL
jgi:hypothetical protein